jgi:prepilin signal peptidase PulO-like enzyme (type II secretory pathway)
MAVRSGARTIRGAATHHAPRRQRRGPSGRKERVNLVSIAVGVAFAGIGAGAERLASVWPVDEARRRRIGARTVLLALASGLAGGAVVARSALPWWATAVYLVLLGLLVVLTATDLEQRRLPHLVLDPLIVLAAAFVPFNPGVEPLMAVIGAAAAVGFLGALALVIRGGLAVGDLYLVTPIGFMLGWPAIFSALFVAAFGAAATGILLLLVRRAGLRSYIPFGPFLVAGAAATLLLDPRLLTVVR